LDEDKLLRAVAYLCDALKYLEWGDKEESKKRRKRAEELLMEASKK